MEHCPNVQARRRHSVNLGKRFVELVSDYFSLMHAKIRHENEDGKTESGSLTGLYKTKVALMALGSALNTWATVDHARIKQPFSAKSLQALECFHLGESLLNIHGVYDKDPREAGDDDEKLGYLVTDSHCFDMITSKRGFIYLLLECFVTLDKAVDVAKVNYARKWRCRFD